MTKKSDGSASMKPYADDETEMTIGGFTIGNGPTCVSLHGSLDLTKDKDGLEKARTLKAMLDAVVSELEGASDLPTKVADDAKPTKTVKNPFA